VEQTKGACIFHEVHLQGEDTLAEEFCVNNHSRSRVSWQILGRTLGPKLDNAC